ncbi:MAG: ELM1/GtrOC1 family putative glycosyltransferase [Candidatus Omnitrophota bacterium]
MKKDSLIAYLLYLPLSLIVLFTRILPIQTVLNFGSFVGKIIYIFSSKRRKVCNNNLKAAFGAQMSYQRRERITKTIFKNFGLSFIELFLMPRMSSKFFGKHTSVQNIERVSEALKKGKGIVFLSAHYGNWELAASISAHNGHKMHALARVQKPYFLNDMLNHFRQVRGTTVIQKGMQLREILKNLRNNGIVGLIGDQSGKQGKKVDFFGRPIFLADGAFRIAAQAGSVVLPAFNIRRSNGFSHELIVEKPIEKNAEENIEEFVERAVLEYRDLLQKYIIQYPHLWLWGNRRWKHTSARTVLILRDGKTGHLRQAQAVAKSIARQTAPVKIVELDVVFKNSFAEKLLNLFTISYGKRVKFPLKFLCLALEKNCYEKLRDAYSDIIVTTGSLTRAVGLLLGIENMSKVISVMKPVPFSENDFDLSIIPAHDFPIESDRVVISNGALNIVTSQYLKDMLGQMPAEIKNSQTLKVGLLIGGNSNCHSLNLDIISKITQQIKRFADENDAEILFSTSRRTPKEIDVYLHKQFDNYPKAVFKVFPNEHNLDYSIGGILAVCPVVVVTSESISMVSEAASSGAYTITYPLLKKNRPQKIKHEIFIDNLEKQKIIRKAEFATLYDELMNFKEKKFKLKKLDDGHDLDNAIKEKIIK